jgi:xanthine/CO dehydrogenase XdhC/CoxF family maturation factor
MKEIRQIIQAFEIAEKQNQKTALATVVHVEGSSYRAPGARMLIRDDGLLTGAISGGCLEGDVLRKALMVIMQDRPLLAVYHTTDEENGAIGIHLGCNGTIRVLIEPVHSSDPQNPVMLLKQAETEKSPVIIVTLFSLKDHRDEWQGTKWLVKNDPSAAHNTPALIDGVHDKTMVHYWNKISDDVKKVSDLQHSLFIHYSAFTGKQLTGNETAPGDITAFLEYLQPEISLIIGGAGNDVVPAVQMAEWMGWKTILIDGRPHYANVQRFAGCQVMIAAPENIFFDKVINNRSACLLMSHNYHYDKAMLRQLSKYPVPYIGMLGPKKKKDRMIHELKEEGIIFSPEQLSRIHSPAGLDIGAETPEEIACSVIAEINMIFSGGTGKSLHTFLGKIHNRKTGIAGATEV